MTSPADSRKQTAARISGVYVIVGSDSTGGPPTLDVARAALEGGACALQLRDKVSSRSELRRAADALRRLCDDAGALLIVNDDPVLARACHADGVHVGQQDASVAECRSLLADEQLVGRSNATLTEASASVEMRADYIAVGAMFPSPTKSDTRPAGVATLREVAALVDIPVVAIGGISLSNVHLVAAAAPDAICVSSAVTGAPDPAQATSDLLRRFRAAKP